jgi:type IV pilus assembly protein PilB
MSTLHTNDGPQTLTRLQDMGVQAFAVATSINIITAQRLLRRLNPNNRVEIEMPDDALKKEDFPEDMIKAGITLYGPGEESEDNPGYKGRAGIYQVMSISDDMKRLIIEGANAVQLGDQAAAEGTWAIRRSGLQKVADGITSLAEVNRVTLE